MIIGEDILTIVTTLLRNTYNIYSWFFENRATKKCQSPALIGN